MLSVDSGNDGSNLKPEYALRDSRPRHANHELKQAMPKYPQRLVNVRIRRRVDLAEYPAIGRATDAVLAELGGRGRVLLRPSGTEPLIRVMVEGPDQEQVSHLAEQLADVVRNELGG